MSSMRILSVRQPWAWLIVHAGKDLENRKWGTPYRGAVAIHASMVMTSQYYESCASWLRGSFPSVTLPAKEELVRGAIIGATQLIGVLDASGGSGWFWGPKALVLADTRPLKRPLPFKGA